MLTQNFQELTQCAVEKAIDPELIEFSFICGSIARGKYTNRSDIDIFVCVREELSKEIKTKFVENYLQLHSDLGLIPDIMYPGEVMTISSLESSMQLAWVEQPATVIVKPALYDGIVWSGMLSDPSKLNLQGKPDILLTYFLLGSLVVERWASELRTQTSQLEHERNDIFLKRVIAYEES